MLTGCLETDGKMAMVLFLVIVNWFSGDVEMARVLSLRVLDKILAVHSNCCMGIISLEFNLCECEMPGCSAFKSSISWHFR